MSISRRTVLKGVGALPLAAGNFSFPALAQIAPTATAAEVPPVLFVMARRCGAVDHNPVADGSTGFRPTGCWRSPYGLLARTDDAVAQPNRSSTEDQRRPGEAIMGETPHRGAARALVGTTWRH